MQGTLILEFLILEFMILELLITMLKLTWIVVMAAELFAADPRIGAWKLVSADSALDPPRVLFTAPQGKGVPVVIPGSTPPRLYCTAAYGGHDNHVQNIPAFHQMVMRRIDKYQSEIEEKKNGALGSDAS